MLRRLVLGAHYDSKITPTGFLGATDSAVPCSMMLGRTPSVHIHFHQFSSLVKNGIIDYVGRGDVAAHKQHINLSSRARIGSNASSSRARGTFSS
jgi:hypothetical protein